MHCRELLESDGIFLGVALTSRGSLSKESFLSSRTKPHFSPKPHINGCPRQDRNKIRYSSHTMRAIARQFAARRISVRGVDVFSSMALSLCHDTVYNVENLAQTLENKVADMSLAEFGRK